MAPQGDDWIAVLDGPLPVAEAMVWVVRADCGAVATFCGTTRDHSDGRSGVVTLEYEAYPEYVEPRLADIARVARERWSAIGRIALLHRVGRVDLGEVSVVVAVSTPHRAEAFEAARFCIDTLKASVPIWKRETWNGGTDWSACAHAITDADAMVEPERIAGQGVS
jgi:molybdopterin synthase catalytic subunit